MAPGPPALSGGRAPIRETGAAPAFRPAGPGFAGSRRNRDGLHPEEGALTSC